MRRSKRWATGNLSRLLVAAASISATACQRGVDPTGGDLPGAPLALDLEPHLTVGGLRDGTPEFHQVRQPSVLPDGRLLVPVQGDRVIHLYGSDGTRLATYGRPGQGPGEFEGLMQAWARGDTIEALDILLRRITRFLPDGSVQIVSLTHPGGAPTQVPGILDDGWVVVRISGAPPGSREQIVIDRFALDGTYIGEIARAEGRKRYAFAGGTGIEPLSPDARVGMRAETLYVGDSLTPGLRLIAPKTLGEKHVLWRHRPEGSPQDAVKRVIELGVARAPAHQAAELRQRLEAVPIPERVPAWSAFMIDEEGFIWVLTYEPERDGWAPVILGGGSSNRWLIFSPTGEEVGAIDMPRNFGPSEITSNSVVGLQVDEWGVQSVVVYPLNRR